MMRLPQRIFAQILQHAQAEAPRECCGLIAVVKGRHRYFPCKNIAETPDEHFILSGWDEVEDQGEVVVIVHSHPNTHPEPSVADRVSCEKSGLPWLIVNPINESWGWCKPSGFELPYVGRNFVFGVVDCYTLVRDWYSREYGIKLRDYMRRDGFWDRGESLYMDNFVAEGFSKIPVGNVQRGDLILMNLVSPLPNHAAIYMGDQQILHHVQGRLSSRDVYGGYYGKSTACALRHESR